MIKIKDKRAQKNMITAGKLLSQVFSELKDHIIANITTLELDNFISLKLKENKLVSQSKGYMGYQHFSCISLNDEVVHGIPSDKKVLKDGDLVKIDICAAWKGYCADMTRCFFVGNQFDKIGKKLVEVANFALENGIAKAVPGNRLGDISFAIQKTVEENGFGIVRNFAGHGIGKDMHEDPEILNYGLKGNGPLLISGMALALEPMITEGDYNVYIEPNGWTARTVDGKLAAHVEDTVIITDNGPQVTTR